ncbi:MAG TPA: diaminopimelate decarboxylase [Firmicutes bacterium]|nr:diaminopimelate decarboxylase [Bacillota bacterium]
MQAGTIQVNTKGHLEIGGCDTLELAGQYGTPLFVMDEELLRKNCRRFRNALRQYYPHGQVIFAGKAFLVLAMARILGEEGLGLDVVSGGELYTALKAEFPAERLFFHGNNKSVVELTEALDAGVGRVVVDSIMELDDIIALARENGKKVAVLLRVRPGVEAHTHEYIQTGQEDSKFGFALEKEAMEAVQRALSVPQHLQLTGFHCHIGSQIFQIEPFALAARTMIHFMALVRQQTGFVASQLNMGGGLGIRYRSSDAPPTIEAFVANLTTAVLQAAKEEDFPLPELLLEPGRAICGEAGITLYRVGVIKNIPGIRRYVSVDGGMMDNIRTALYGADYEAVLANKANREGVGNVTIAGKACESGDILIYESFLPQVEKGDLLAIFSTGAYCYAMASNYNRNPRPAVVFVRNGKGRVVVRRESYEHVAALDL